jgi:DNA-binding NtrC family response regulator
MRATGRRKVDDEWLGRSLPSSVNQLTGLIGQMPLKSIVRETTDLIERMCIETALQIVGDNRASAAQMLGLSRQSFYMKLRRFGIGDRGHD